MKPEPIVYFSSQIKWAAYIQSFSLLSKALDDYGIHYAFLNNTRDIWCRDYMPIQVGENQFVQFCLTNDYYQKENKHLQTDPSPICESIGIKPTIPEYQGQPI